MAQGGAAAPLANAGASAPPSTQLNYARQRAAREDHEYMDVRSSDEDDLDIDSADDDDENDYDYDGPVAVERLATASNDNGHFGSSALSSSSQRTLLAEVAASAELVFFHSRLNVLMLGGVVAVVGDTTGLLGEPICFCLSGLALIPCAERLSFLTEQVAEHTNGTIGALLNATFGNAPELLISIAALRSGFYRVVQLAMLGSILTNMMLVFGVACLIGGARWQVQVLRLTSGNVSVVMLLVSTAGFLFPAALLLSGQFNNSYGPHDKPSDLEQYVPTQVEISFGRVNAAVMMILYVLFLLFTLGTHHEEFDSETLKDHSERRAQRNLFCLRHFHRARETLQRPRGGGGTRDAVVVPGLELLPLSGDLLRRPKAKTSAAGQDDGSLSSDDEDDKDGDPHRKWGAANRSSAVGTEPGSRSLQKRTSSSVNGHSDRSTGETVEEGLSRASFNSDTATAVRRNGARPSSSSGLSPQPSTIEILTPPASPVTSLRMKNYTDHLLGSASPIPLALGDPGMDVSNRSSHRQPALSMRAGIFWLFVLTLCISALSDILVDTIDGFAQRMNLSQVFTSMVVVPFFSNVAEQVSAFLFAYRNEMDLVVGVTIGSAIQIASFVLPGSVLIGMIMDRSMTLYFRAYETVCMLFGVIVVGAVLQGGTTNWLVGAVLVGIYIIMATGIWYHELENLSVDGEDLIRNATYPDL